MADAGFFRGTSAEQDNRFSDKEKKLLKQMRFADSISKKIDMSLVKLEVLKPWIAKRISELLGMEDDVVNEFVYNQLEDERNPDGRRIQINLTGFLNGKNARIFTGELWDMLISAQESPSGVPTSLIDSKKEEIKQREAEKERISETIKRTVSRFTDRLRTDSPSTTRNSGSSYRNGRARSPSPRTGLKSRDRNNDTFSDANSRISPKIDSLRPSLRSQKDKENSSSAQPSYISRRTDSLRSTSKERSPKSKSRSKSGSRGSISRSRSVSTSPLRCFKEGKAVSRSGSPAQSKSKSRSPKPHEIRSASHRSKSVSGRSKSSSHRSRSRSRKSRSPTRRSKSNSRSSSREKRTYRAHRKKEDLLDEIKRDRERERLKRDRRSRSPYRRRRSRSRSYSPHRYSRHRSPRRIDRRAPFRSYQSSNNSRYFNSRPRSRSPRRSPLYKPHGSRSPSSPHRVRRRSPSPRYDKHRKHDKFDKIDDRKGRTPPPPVPPRVHDVEIKYRAIRNRMKDDNSPRRERFAPRTPSVSPEREISPKRRRMDQSRSASRSLSKSPLNATSSVQNSLAKSEEPVQQNSTAVLIARSRLSTETRSPSSDENVAKKKEKRKKKKKESENEGNNGSLGKSKKRKKEKKHKKHKKHKKKKSKVKNESTDDNEEDDEDDEEGNDGGDGRSDSAQGKDSSPESVILDQHKASLKFLGRIKGRARSPNASHSSDEDLEKTLREKALQSMKQKEREQLKGNHSESRWKK